MADAMCTGDMGRNSSLPALTADTATPASRPCHTGKWDYLYPLTQPLKSAMSAAALGGWGYTTDRPLPYGDRVYHQACHLSGERDHLLASHSAYNSTTPAVAAVCG
ncbi:Hypothetical predicted protein [Pelobates cultripes]|uniref:Uncharacterized protein n=1 Tax=Pelobates cultripes TaxID=61616 RepID=A0AAD1WSB5_PELCU|nr:Hypothetical predicted protein [Pelobates cultripes]